MVFMVMVFIYIAHFLYGIYSNALQITKRLTEINFACFIAFSCSISTFVGRFTVVSSLRCKFSLLVGIHLFQCKF